MTNKEAIFKLIKYRRRLEEDSTIDAEPFDMAIDALEGKHGKWVLEHLSQLWECTNCHEREIRTTDFCPNCGADMRGENNGMD